MSKASSFDPSVTLPPPGYNLLVKLKNTQEPITLYYQDDWWYITNDPDMINCHRTEEIEWWAFVWEILLYISPRV